MNEVKCIRSITTVPAATDPNATKNYFKKCETCAHRPSALLMAE